VSVRKLRCFECGHGYGYVGDDSHPARCPACHSSLVPPSGSLAVFDRSSWESANGLAKLRISAVDELGRLFEFGVAARGETGKLVELRIDDAPVDPRVIRTVVRIPPTVEAELAEAGLTVEPTSSGHPRRPSTSD